MRRKLFLIALSLLIGSPAFAVPTLQLFISGATYDWGTQTWVTTSGSFDLYVVSANSSKTDVIVSLALAPTDNPADVSVNFAGTDIHTGDWVFGYSPLENDPTQWDGGNDDLPRHGIFPTWFSEMHTGAYNRSSWVGDVQPDAYGNFWNPANGSGQAHARGQVKHFHVTTGGVFTFVHFDAYTLNSDGTINQFAPFSHDAEAGYVPEPGTAALFSTGLMALGAISFRRRKR